MRISDWSSDVCSSDLDAAQQYPISICGIICRPTGGAGSEALRRTEGAKAGSNADSRLDRSRTCKENKSAPVLDSPCGIARRQGARQPGTERTTGTAREIGWLRQERQKARQRQRAGHHKEQSKPPAPKT